MTSPADKLRFVLEGTNGKAVLLLHGLTGIPAEMMLVARRLHRAGYSVIAPLITGHGEGKEALLKTRWQDWRDGVLDEVHTLAPHYDQLTTAGICVGGKLGMLAAHAVPELISACAIYSPCFRYDGWNVPWYYKLGPLGIPIIAHIPILRNFSYPETPTLGIKDERLRRFMQSSNTEGVIDEFPLLALREMLRLGGALSAALPSLHTPTLIVHARTDDLSHPRNALRIDTRIAAPHELQWIEESYHMIHVDKQHPKVADLTADFFARMKMCERMAA
jgi:carboxylesterase